VEIERGLAGARPYAATGSGSSVVVLAGLWPTTGVGSDQLVRGAVAPLRRLGSSRRLVVFNRRSHLPTGLTMVELAAEYADAVRAEFGAPVDVMGASTGGSIAQQLAGDHPEVVRRLVLVSTACRLGPVGRELQSQVAARLRAGQVRSAVSLAAANLAPRGLRTLARGLAWTAARHVLGDPTAAADLATTLEAEDGFDLARWAGAISARTLIVAGGRDRFYGSDLFRATAALIPGSQLLLLPRRGHITVASDARAQATIAGFLS
jgi:pimeloyl-ACP methyl ester carboxylesterase